MGKLRLLLVGPLPPPSGGMANQTQQLKRLLEGEGIDVVLVQTNAPYRPAWVASLQGVRALFRLVPYFLELRRNVRGVDVVHVMANSGLSWDLFAAPAIYVAKRSGRPVIVNYRGGLAGEFLVKAAPRVRRTLHGTQLVVPSEFLRRIFDGYGLAAAVIPNVVDTRTFHPRASASKHAFDDPFHVVIARNLEDIYGIDIGLRALARLRMRIPSIRASVAGTGPQRGQLQALASELNLHDCITFTGRLDVAAMAALYRSADLVLNPVRADNTPNSVLEALASGVPVVSTNVGGIPFLVEHENTAILVEPESPSALCDAMARVLGDEELRARLAENGLELARKCAWPVVKARWLRVYGISEF